MLRTHIVCCLVMLIPAATPTSGLDAQDAAEELPGPDAGSLADTKQALVDRMVLELSNLIPGEYAGNSERRQRLSDIASAFLAGDENGTRVGLNELSKSDPQVPPHELLLAGMAFAAGNAVQGKILLERAGDAHRKHPGIALAFGRLALSQGRFYDAHSLIEQARQLNETSNLGPDAKKFYKAGALNSLTILEIRRNKLDLAQAFARQWEKVVPDDNQMLFASAEIEFLQNRDDSSITYLDRRTSQSKDELPTAIVLGRWYRNRGDTEKHTEWINEAYEKHPQNPRAQLEYAALLLRQEKFDAVEPVITAYETENGETVESRVIRGRIAFSKKDYGLAESHFAEVYRLQPDNLEYSYLYVLSLLESGNASKYQGAIEIAQRNIQIFPGNQLAIASLGWAYLKNNNRDLGQQLLTRASRTGELMPDTGYFLAKMMYDQGRKIQAKIILDPFLESPEVFLFRSSARQMIEELNQN